MAFDIDTLDLDATMKDKVWFAAVAIPVSGVVGATLRVAGVSESVTLMIVLPLLCVAFVAWHVGIAIRRARRGAADAEHDVWHRRDADAAQYPQRRIHTRPSNGHHTEC